MNKVTSFRVRQRVMRFMSVGIYPVILLAFIILALLQGYAVYQTHEELEAQVAERARLQDIYERYRSNAKISEAQRLAYGTIIKLQIPRSNDVFDVFSLIDAFKERTSIELTQSSDTGGGSGSSTSSTVSNGRYLLGSAVMNDETLTELTRIYQYEFHRFMTLDKITVDRVKDSSTPLYRVSLIFQIYDLDTAPAGKSATKQVFGPADLARFEQYMEDTNIDIYYQTQQAPAVETEYERSQTIF